MGSNSIQDAERTFENLPRNTRARYESSYSEFEKWRTQNNITSYAEEEVLAYIRVLSTKYKPSTIWVIFSMLKATLKVKQKVNLSEYYSVIAFLKRLGHGYKPQQCEPFTKGQIASFLNNADDKVYLFTKVVLIVGISGGCQKKELLKLCFTDFKDLGNNFLVTSLTTGRRKKAEGTFIIHSNFYTKVKKYMDLRPPGMQNPRFFIFYAKGHCRCQVVGINKLAAVPKVVASFLKLPNPEKYNFDSLRRTCASKEGIHRSREQQEGVSRSVTESLDLDVPNWDDDSSESDMDFDESETATSDSNGASTNQLFVKVENFEEQYLLDKAANEISTTDVEEDMKLSELPRNASLSNEATMSDSNNASTSQLPIKEENFEEQCDLNNVNEITTTVEDVSKLPILLPNERLSSASNSSLDRAPAPIIAGLDVLQVANDEFNMFGICVASQLRKMPLDTALLAQCKIQELMAALRMKTRNTTNMSN